MVKKASKKAGSPNKRAKVSKAKAKSTAKTKAKTEAKSKSKSPKVSKKVAKKSLKSKSVRAMRTKNSKSSAKKKSLGVISTGAGAKLAGKVGSAPPAAEVVLSKKTRYKSLPLKPEELDQFRASLLKQRREIRSNVSRMRAEALEKNRQDAAGNLSKFPTSPADLGTDNYEQEFTLSLMEGERDLLKEIDDALRRLDGGAYGTCEATGQAIARDRLTFEPWARYTVEYASLLEKGLVSTSPAGPDESDQ